MLSRKKISSSDITIHEFNNGRSSKYGNILPVTSLDVICHLVSYLSVTLLGPFRLTTEKYPSVDIYTREKMDIKIWSLLGYVVIWAPSVLCLIWASFRYFHADTFGFRMLSPTYKKTNSNSRRLIEFYDFDKWLSLYRQIFKILDFFFHIKSV